MFFDSSPIDVDNQQLLCDSDSKGLAHSCVPTPVDVEKAKLVNTPNDKDSVDTAKLNEIITHCTETSELDMWKAKVHKLEGIIINVPYDGKKIIKWKIEGVVTTRNTHNELASDFHP